MADNDYYHRLSEMNPGELADGLAMEAEFDAIGRGFDKLPAPHRDGQGFEGPVRVGDATNPDEAINKGQLDNVLGTAKQLAVATYGNFNSVAWGSLPSGTYLLFGTGSQITNSPFTLVAAKTYYFAVHHAIGTNLYFDSVLMSSYDDNTHIDIGREAWRSGPTLAAASTGWKAALIKNGDTATGDILGVTAPQFVNDKKFATTEFVQRALGNKSKFVNHAISETILATDVGAEHWVSGGAGKVLTLPLVSSVPAGSMLYFYGNSHGMTIVRQGSDSISNGLLGAVTSLTLGGQGRVALCAGGSSWYVVDGVSSLAGSTEFGSSLAANGYQKLPSGLIIQWGTTASTVAAGSVAVTFPIAFPNAAFAAIATTIAGGVSVPAANIASPISTTGMTVWLTSATAGFGVRFIVIGY